MADSVGEQANGSVGTAHSLGNSVLGHSSASPPPADTGLVEPAVAVPPSLPTGIVSGVPAGAGLLSQLHATSWDPTLSTDWDNEKASQQCILRIKRLFVLGNARQLVKLASVIFVLLVYFPAQTYGE